MCLVLGRGQYSTAATTTPTRRLIMHVWGAPLTFLVYRPDYHINVPTRGGRFELLIWGRVPASPHPCRSAIWNMSWEPLIWPLGGLMLRALGTSGGISGDSMKQRASRSPGWEGLFCTGFKFPRSARRRLQQERCSPGRPGGYPGGQVSWVGGDWSQRCGLRDPGTEPACPHEGQRNRGERPGANWQGRRSAVPGRAAAGSGGDERGAHPRAGRGGGRRLSEPSASCDDQQVSPLPREGGGSVRLLRLLPPSFPSTSGVRLGPAKRTLRSEP